SVGLTVDDLHRVEVQGINHVQRGLPAAPLQVGSGHLLPVRVGVARQGGNRRPGSGWQISYLRHVAIQSDSWFGITRGPWRAAGRGYRGGATPRPEPDAGDNAVYSVQRSVATSIRSGPKHRARVYQHDRCLVKHAALRLPPSAVTLMPIAQR